MSIEEIAETSQVHEDEAVAIREGYPSNDELAEYEAEAAMILAVENIAKDIWS